MTLKEYNTWINPGFSIPDADRPREMCGALRINE